MRVESFPPIVGEAPVVLVLGSMPSIASLEKQQYYGHARNAFWPLMAALFGFDASLDYDARRRALQQAGVAVWDVLASCERVGSLDAAIARDTEHPNDLIGLASDHTTLRHVFLNGRKAEQVWKRHFAPWVELPATTLPSTSPAMASLDFAGKLTAWQVVRDEVDAARR